MPSLPNGFRAAHEDAAVPRTRPCEDALVLEMPAFNASQAPMTERVFATSDAISHTSGRPERFSGRQPQPEVRPQTATPAVSPSQEAVVTRIYDDPRGRPKDAETKRRHREFLRVLSATGSFEQAIEQSGMATSRLPKILDEMTFRQICVAIMDGVAPNPLAVVVEPVEAQAA